MKLPNLPFLSKKSEEEFFIALLFKPKSIIAILLNNQNGALSIVSTKSVSLDLDSASIEEIIASSDEAISSIELSVDETKNLEKTIFSLPYSWVDHDGSIKKEKLLQLKKLSVELALKPMGFIISMEALIKYFQDKDGIPLNAIFVEEAKNKIYLYLVKGGNIAEVQSGEVTEEVEKSVEHTLKKVENFKQLPSKMILLYHDDIDSRQQNFLNYPWTKDLPFLHLPQISLLEKGFENEAVVDAIASQLNVNISSKTEIAGAELMTGDAASVASDDESFGFMKEKDVAEIRDDLEEERVDAPVIHVSGERKSESDDSIDYDEKKSESAVPSMIGLSALLALPKKIFALVKMPSGASSRIRMLFIPILAVILFVIFMVVYYLAFLKAEVVVFLDARQVKDEVVVDLSEDSETSYEDAVLHIDTIDQQVEGEVSIDATGTEEVGESAKGEVTILSSQNKSQTIEKGATLTSSNGLKYTLDDEVKLASSSGISDIKSAKGKVTASEIGREYNLPSNTKFSISGFDSSSLEAKNDQAFAGGTKEEKKIVSEKDIASLEEKLLTDLFEEAVNAAKSKVSGEQEIISVLLDSNIENDDYSAAAGDEVESVKLTATVSYTLGVYKREEAEKFIKDSQGGDVPEGFVLSDDDSQINLKDIEEGKDAISGVLSYEVNYKPDIKFESLAEEIKGKSVSSAEEFIKKSDGVSDVSIIFKNKLPLLPSILPMRSSQIEIVQRTQDS